MKIFSKKETRRKPQKQYKGSIGFRGVISIFLRTIKLMLDFFYILAFWLMLLGAGLSFGYLASQIEDVTIPENETLLTNITSVSQLSQMNYSNGSLISMVDSDLLRTPVESDQISENVKLAIIATEDENFENHNGVVPKAVFRATMSSLLGLGESSGGSSITQQLIKQQILGDDPTFSRKSAEIIYALALERSSTKDDILTNYLNVSPFGRNNKGQNIAGVEEAAQGIFGVSAKDLTIPQAAFIAGLPQSPIVYSPYAADGTLKDEEGMSYGIWRAQNVLYNMYRTGLLTEEEYNNYSEYDISKDFLEPEVLETDSHDYLYYTVFNEAVDIMYDYLIERDKVSEQDLKSDETVELYKEKASEALRLGGYTVTTTIDKDVYKAMQSAASTYGSIFNSAGNDIQVGNVLMDNATGAVIGFIGGRDYETNQNNHAYDTERSPGSSIKPWLAYGIAIDQGLMGSASILSNYPTNFSSGQAIMHSTDRGTAMVTLQEAFDVSWNIPAYWTYQMLLEQGVDVESYIEKMNINIPNYYIESLPLGGGADISVVQNTNAYQTIANNGQYIQQHVVDSITASDGTVIYQFEAEPVTVYSEATATILQELLKGPISSGKTTYFADNLKKLNSDLESNVDWIGKTGTTDNYTDVWLMLATPTVTLGGWAGNDENESMSSASGYNLNAQYMANLVNAINAAKPGIFGDGQKFSLSDTVTKSEVLTSTGQLPGAVSINGSTYNLNGNTTTSYWANDSGAPTTTYRFAIGGTDSNYQSAWSSILGSTSKSTTSSSSSTTTSSSSD